MNKFAINLGFPNSVNIEILAKLYCEKKKLFNNYNIDLIQAQLKLLKKN